MAFNMKPARSGAGRRKPRLSIAAASYRVNFKDGKKRMYGDLKEIYGSTGQETVDSIYDRHAGAFLDLDVLWKNHRRKFVPASIG